MEELQGEALDRLGESVLLSNSTLAVAGNGLLPTNGASFVDVYSIQPSGLGRLGRRLVGDVEFVQIPRALAMSPDGQTIALGENFYSPLGVIGQATGHVKVYRYDGDDWIQIGQDLIGTDDLNGQFGGSVALSSNNVLAVGAPRNDLEGLVNVYQLQSITTTTNTTESSEWKVIGTVPMPDGADEWGTAVALSENGRILAVGDPYYDNKIGIVEIFHYESVGIWKKLGDSIIGTQDVDGLGHLVQLSADGYTVALSTGRSDRSADSFVRVYTLARNMTQWKKVGADIVGQPASGTGSDQASISLSLSADGKSVAVGSPAGSGNARVYRYQNSVEQWLLVGQESVGATPGDQYGNTVSLVVPDGAQAYWSVGGRFRDYVRRDNAGHVKLFTMEASCFREREDLTNEEATVENLAIRFNGLDTFLDQAAIVDFEDVSMEWFEKYFEENEATVEGMVSKIIFRDQNLEPSVGSTPAGVTIEFAQRLVYVQSSDSNYTAEELVVLPFNASESVTKYSMMLIGTNDAFEKLQMPIEPPYIVPPDQGDQNVIFEETNSLSTGAIAGIVAAAVVVGLAVAGLVFRRYKATIAVAEVVDQAHIANPHGAIDYRVGDADVAVMAEIVDESEAIDGSTHDPPAEDFENDDVEPHTVPGLDGPEFKDQVRYSTRGHRSLGATALPGTAMPFRTVTETGGPDRVRGEVHGSVPRPQLTLPSNVVRAAEETGGPEFKDQVRSTGETKASAVGAFTAKNKELRQTTEQEQISIPLPNSTSNSSAKDSDPSTDDRTKVSDAPSTTPAARLPRSPSRPDRHVGHRRKLDP